MIQDVDPVNETLLFVTDWELLLVSAVGGCAVGGSVCGLLLYGAYKVNTFIFEHCSLFLYVGFTVF